MGCIARWPHRSVNQFLTPKQGFVNHAFVSLPIRENVWWPTVLDFSMPRFFMSIGGGNMLIELSETCPGVLSLTLTRDSAPSAACAIAINQVRSSPVKRC